ncbi:MAG: hypothetical protein ACLFUG_03890, partial [Nitriliruptoraceae bacterium]
MSGGIGRTATGLALAVASYLGVRSGRLDRLDAHCQAVLVSPTPRRLDPVVAVATDLGSSFG